ncbi:MAG: flagellar hook-length control protein FliK [Mitsuokella sp.]
MEHTIQPMQAQAGASAKGQVPRPAARAMGTGVKASTDQSFDAAMSRARSSRMDAKDVKDAKADRTDRNVKAAKDDAATSDVKSAARSKESGPSDAADAAEDAVATEAAAMVQGAGTEEKPKAAEDGSDPPAAAGDLQDAAAKAAAPQAGLQSLMPQDAAAQAKSQDFLAMLSGQQLKNAGKQEAQGEAIPAWMQPVKGQAQETPSVQAATPLEAGLAQAGETVDALLQPMPNAAPHVAVQASGAMQAASAEGEAVQAQPAAAMVTGVAVEPDAQGMAAQVATPLQAAQQNAAQHAAAAPIQQAGKTSEQGAGAEVQQPAQGVQQSAAPIAPALQAAKDGGQGAGKEGQQQDGSQDQQGGAPAQAAPEKAKRDAAHMDRSGAQSADAPAQVQPRASTAAAPSAFQQTLHESIMGTRQAPPQQPQADYDIPRQIVDQARLIRRAADTEMVIKLKPEHLGELTLRISVSEGGAVSASFHSPHAEVRAAIENSLVQLRQDLNNQGIKVDNVEVFSGMSDQLPQGQGGQAYQDPQGHAGSGAQSSQGQGMDAENYADEADALAAAAAAQALGADRAQTPHGLTQGVDYRI